MPCRNDWDPPTKAQAENRRAAKMLIALNNIQGKTSSTQLLVDSTNPVLDTDYVKVLCERMKALSDSDREAVLYGDAHDPRARDLATWWEEHQARDEVRMRTSPTLNLLGVCSEAMREAGKPYPRTCLVCGLGPCQRGRQLMVGVDLAGGPDMTVISVVPRLQPGQQEYLVPVPREPQQAAPVEWPVGHSWARKMAALEAAEESDPTTPIIAPQQAEPVAWRTAEKYSPDVGSWFDYYDEFATVNDKTGLQPLYLHPPTAEVQRLQSLVDRLDESNVRLRGAMHAAIEDHDEHRPLTAAIEAMRTTLLERPDDGAVQRLRAALECIEKCTTDQLNRVIARRALEGK